MLKIIHDIQQEIPNMINEKKALDILQKTSEPFNFILVQEVKMFTISTYNF